MARALSFVLGVPGVVACGDDVSAVVESTETGVGTGTSTGSSAGETTSSGSAASSGGEGSTSSGADESSSTSGAASDVRMGVCDPYENVVRAFVMLNAQSAVSRSAGIECVDGAIGIYRGPDDDLVEDLSPLSSLRAVSEHVAISNTALVELHGLEGLEWVGGDLVIGELIPGFPGCSENPDLTSLDGLAGLQHLENLLLCGDSNDALVSMAGLDSALEGEIEGKIEITDLRVLTSIAALDGVTSAATGIVLINLPMVDDLSPLQDVTQVGGMTVANVGMADLQGLESLASVDYRLWFDSNPQLETLAGLDAIASVGALYITNNPNLPQAEAAALAATIDVAEETVICGNLGGDAC